MDRNNEALIQDGEWGQEVNQNNQSNEGKCFNSNTEDENLCCKKSKSRISELEFENCSLKKYISSLNDQLHEAHEKAEDISFIKNESVITLGDKLDSVTSMLEEKTKQNNDIVDCKRHFIKYDLDSKVNTQEVCGNVMNELIVAKQKLIEISDSIKDIKLVCIGKERKKVISNLEEKE